MTPLPTPEAGPRSRTWLSLLGLAAACALIFAATLSGEPVRGNTIVVELCSACGERAVADAAVNLLLFVPLGVSLAYAGASRRARWLVPLLVSVAVELAQVFLPGRFTTLSDIAANTLGGFVGTALPAASSWWLQPVAATHRLWLGAIIATTVLIANAILLRPQVSHEADVAHWVPDFERLERWNGRVLDARIGGMSVPAGSISGPSRPLAALANGATLDLRVEPAGTNQGVAPIFALTQSDAVVSAELLAVDETLLWRQRHRGAALRLESAGTRFEQAGALMPTGTIVTLALTREAQAHCLRVNDSAMTCVPLPGIGSAWQLLYAPDTWSSRARRMLDIAGLALLLLPAALAAPHAALSASRKVLLLLVGAMLAAPRLGPLAAPGVAEAWAVVLVFAVCWRLRRRPPRAAELPDGPSNR